MNEFEKAYASIILESAETSNIAKEEGKYENFTGTIEFGWNKGTVKNATFELTSYTSGGMGRKTIIWEDGIWEDGKWDNGTWKNGTWKNGKWVFGYFKGGVWEKGNVWEGYFSNMTWKNGNAIRGKFTNCVIENGKLGSAALSLSADGCTFKNGNFCGTWYNGTFEGGTFDGIFNSGKFTGGTFENGFWDLTNHTKEKRPVWEGGIWKSGHIKYETVTKYKYGKQVGNVKQRHTQTIKSDVNPNEALKDIKNLG